MGFGQRIRERREELGMSRKELARRLGVTLSAVSNYETGVSFPREDFLLRLFDCLETEPNALFRDSFRGGESAYTDGERTLIEHLRGLSYREREAVRDLVEALRVCRDERKMEERPAPEPRQIPLYRSPAAAGYTAPVFGEDFDYIDVAVDVPLSAEYAVRIQGDSMSPWIGDGDIAYVDRDPLDPGDVGIFCVDGEMFCKQYYKDPAGVVYLFSLNRARADADLVLGPTGGRSLICLGRVILRAPPLPGTPV